MGEKESRVKRDEQTCDKEAQTKITKETNMLKPYFKVVEGQTRYTNEDQRKRCVK